MNVPSTEPELHSLMIAGLRGEASAHRTLLEKLSGQLRGYYKGQLDRVGRGPVEAEDLVQEALIAIHTRRHTFDPSQPLTPWVYAIARYKFLDYLRRTRVSLQEVWIEEEKDISTRGDQAGVDSSLDLQKLMSALPPKVRSAIKAVKLDGLSVSEVAAQTGMSESNVKVSVHRGLKAMAQLISGGRI